MKGFFVETKFPIFIFSIIFLFEIYAQEASTSIQNDPKEIQEIQNSSDLLLNQLNSLSKIERTWARFQLKKLGEIYISKWIAAIPKMNYHGRRELIILISQFKTQEVVDVLIKSLEDEDYGVRNQSYLALLDICCQDTKLLEKIPKKNYKTNKYEDIQKFWDTYYAKKVEDCLEDLISPYGGFGSYDGQFDNMLFLEENAIPYLISIFEEKEYQYVNIRLQYNTDVIYKLRYLAGQSFPAFQKFFSKKTREKVIQTLLRMLNSIDEEEIQLKEIAKTSLYFLGHTEYLNREIQLLRDKVNVFPDPESLADLGHLYLRIRQEEEGIKYLKLSIRMAPNYAHAYYNLACAYGCMGDEANAMNALEDAVKKGYDDVEWIIRDGDLRILHKNPRFKKLIQELQNKFMINPANIGNGK